MTKASWPRGADLNPLVEIPEKIVPPKRYKLEKHEVDPLKGNKAGGR